MATRTADIQLETSASVDGHILEDGDTIAFTDDSNANEFIEWDSTPFDAGARDTQLYKEVETIEQLQTTTMQAEVVRLLELEYTFMTQ